MTERERGEYIYIYSAGYARDTDTKRRIEPLPVFSVIHGDCDCDCDCECELIITATNPALSLPAFFFFLFFFLCHTILTLRLREMVQWSTFD